LSDIFAGNGLSIAEFLRDYWQRKPLLLRQAFPGFVPELDPDDIAGLACDELAEARLVTGCYPENRWTVRHGPFERAELTGLPDSNWTLLVQDVEKHYPPLRGLLDSFRFLPSWRIDDVMASVAAPGGSVGPHVDQYDVFLLQAAGSRRWQITARFDEGLLPDCELKVLQRFVPEQEWILQPGDILYLPPGVAHHGVATSDSRLCMTWSVGMRAPSSADLLQALGDWLADRQNEGPRYRDPALAPATRPGEIDADAIQALRQLLHGIIDGSSWPEFLGSFLSSYRMAQEPAPPERKWTPARLRRALESGAALQQHPWTRLAWLRHGDGALLCAGGTTRPCSVAAAVRLCDPVVLARAPEQDWSSETGLLVELLNEGHLIFETV